MAEQQTKSKNLVKDISFRVAKAAVKAILVYLLYFFLAPMLAPLFEMMPGLMESLEVFVAEFPSLDEAQTWAGADPYVAAGVYAQVSVKPFKKVFPQ